MLAKKVSLTLLASVMLFFRCYPIKNVPPPKYEDKWIGKKIPLSLRFLGFLTPNYREFVYSQAN